MNDAAQEDLLNIDELKIRYTYGRFWSRFWALLLDGLILAILVPLVTYNSTTLRSGIVLIVVSCIQIAYKPFFEYAYGATPGKMGLKLRVVNYQYGKASFNEIFLRNIFSITAGLITTALKLYNFYFLSSGQASVYLNDSFIGGATFMAEFAWIIILIIYLVDLGFLLTSPDSRSLHDRIGKTYVIKLQ